MPKTILLLLTLTLILGAFTSCGYKTTNMFDDQTSSSLSKDTTTERKETTEDTEDIDITREPPPRKTKAQVQLRRLSPRTLLTSRRIHRA